MAEYLDKEAFKKSVEEIVELVDEWAAACRREFWLKEIE